MYKDNAETPRSKRACWNRIEAVINMAQMTTNAFARHIGLPRGENLYQIKRGNNGVSLDLANRIVAKFSEVSKLWLLTGDGPMLIEKTEPARLTPWAYFAGTALHALIAKDVDYPEKSAAHYADRTDGQTSALSGIHRAGSTCLDNQTGRHSRNGARERVLHPLWHR